MIKEQLKELPSVSQVLHQIKSDISLHNRYIKIGCVITLNDKLFSKNRIVF